MKAYGKGTAVDGGTKLVLGNDRGAYAPDKDYRDAVVMVAIYPYADKPYADVFWKNNQKKYNDNNFKILSMGMSDDFEIAIQEGANMVRVGTAIFGERNYDKQEVLR